MLVNIDARIAELEKTILRLNDNLEVRVKAYRDETIRGAEQTGQVRVNDLVNVDTTILMIRNADAELRGLRLLRLQSIRR